MNGWPAALASRPLLIAEAHAFEMREAWLAAEAEANTLMQAGRYMRQDGPRYAVQDGVAIIPISGVLLNRYDFLGDGSAYTSYGAITREVNRAAGDTSIKAIVLAVSSPGGTADGILAPSAAIRAARKAKPVTALVGSMAASGGYWLAAQAGEIVLSNDMSSVGSIGVYTMHMDVSGLLKSMGVDISVIHSGANKIDGHPFSPLPANVRADMQQDVDDLRLMFAQAIFAGRPAIPVSAALATEAKMFNAFNPRDGSRPAIARKLADRVGSLSAVISGIKDQPRRLTETRSIPMTSISQEEHDRAVRAARAEGHAAGNAQSAAQSPSRISDIMTSAEGKANPKFAAHLANETSMSVNEARAALAAATPVASASDPKAIWSKVIGDSNRIRGFGDDRKASGSSGPGNNVFATMRAEEASRH